MKFDIGGDRFSDEQSSKTGGLLQILEKYCTYRQKRSTEVLNTNYTANIKIKVYFKIKPERR